MVLIQMLLPKSGPDGESFAAHVATTRTELVEKFGGMTAYERAPASGAWRDEAGSVEHDEMIMIEVVAEQFDREFWRAYSARLRVRFDQREMHVRAIALEML